MHSLLEITAWRCKWSWKAIASRQRNLWKALPEACPMSRYSAKVLWMAWNETENKIRRRLRVGGFTVDYYIKTSWVPTNTIHPTSWLTRSTPKLNSSKLKITQLSSPKNIKHVQTWYQQSKLAFLGHDLDVELIPLVLYNHANHRATARSRYCICTRQELCFLHYKLRDHFLFGWKWWRRIYRHIYQSQRAQCYLLGQQCASRCHCLPGQEWKSNICNESRFHSHYLSSTNSILIDPCLLHRLR